MVLKNSLGPSTPEQHDYCCSVSSSSQPNQLNETKTKKTQNKSLSKNKIKTKQKSIHTRLGKTAASSFKKRKRKNPSKQDPQKSKTTGWDPLEKTTRKQHRNTTLDLVSEQSNSKRKKKPNTIKSHHNSISNKPETPSVSSKTVK